MIRSVYVGTYETVSASGEPMESGLRYAYQPFDAAEQGWSDGSRSAWSASTRVRIEADPSLFLLSPGDVFGLAWEGDPAAKLLDAGPADLALARPPRRKDPRPVEGQLVLPI